MGRDLPKPRQISVAQQDIAPEIHIPTNLRKILPKMSFDVEGASYDDILEMVAEEVR